MATTMIAADLERMGDLACSIAERTLALVRLPALPAPAQLPHMTDLTVSMVHGSLEAFVRLDTEQARRIILQDDEVDRLNAEIIQEVLAGMARGPEFIEPGLSLFSAVRHLERIADHATNIAEDVIYLVEGQIVRHHPEALNLPRPEAAAAPTDSRS
jgi:phosphate transport system protein